MEPIDPNKRIQTITIPQTGNVRSKPGKSSFDAVFKRQLDTDNVQPPPPQSSSLVSGIHPAQFALESRPSGKTVIDQIHMLVDTMAAYRDKLAESGAPLKDVAPLVKEMESQNEALSAISGAIGGKDGKLQEMLEQSLMLSKLEISKFRSGYYNDG